MILHTDCRDFRAAHPCRPHKQSGIRCSGCLTYDKVLERIVIVKLGALGDVLRTTSCLLPLKVRYPGCHITWVTRPNARPILDANPAVDRVLTIDEPYLELLMAEEFDLAIGPEAELLSASIMKLVRCGEKRGFIADGRGGLKPLGNAAREWWLTSLDDGLKQSNRRTYNEWLYEVCELPTPIAPPMLSVAAAAHARVRAFMLDQIGEGRPTVCINTGASERWREKRWKAAQLCELAHVLSEDAPDLALILVGGPEEEALNRALLAARVGFIDGGIHRSIEDFGALIAACDWMLTPDSLGYHVACAVGTPAVCLVGPTSPWELDRYGRNLILHSDVPCISCYLAECPLPLTCMDVLSPRRVWKEARNWRKRLHGTLDRVQAVEAVAQMVVLKNDVSESALAAPAPVWSALKHLAEANTTRFIKEVHKLVISAAASVSERHVR
jgi:ADP-heptose:LPS heptosyltransferase